MPGEKKHRHYAFAILFSCCLLQGGTLGMIQNCRGIFFTPICEELGVGLGAFTFYLLFFGIASCLILPWAGKVFPLKSIKAVMGIPSIVFALATVASAYVDSLAAFYVLGAIQGMASAFLMYFPIPLILGNWFQKQRGLMIGIASAVAGLVGVIMNPVGAAMIERWGWRVTSVIFGLLSLAMTLPVSLLLVRLRPEEMGLLPYGAREGEVQPQETEAEGIPYPEAKGTPAFRLLVLVAFLAAFVCGYYAHMSTFGVSKGYTAAVGAQMISMCMMGNIVSKVGLGWYYDRAGIRKALRLGNALILMGFLLLLLSEQKLFLYLGCLLFGCSMGVSTVVIPILARELFGRRDFSRIGAVMTMCTALAVPSAGVLIGYLYDWQHTYEYGLALGIGLTLLLTGVAEVLLGGRHYSLLPNRRCS